MSDFKAKCTKIDFGWGSAPDPAERGYSTLSDPLVGITFKERRRCRKGEGEGEEERRGEGREGRGTECASLNIPVMIFFKDTQVDIRRCTD